MTNKDRSEYFRAYAEEQKGLKHRVKSTFSNDEFEKIDALAKEYGLKPASFVREVTLSAMSGKVFLDDEAKQELRNITFLIRNISNNVNQMAKLSNSLKGVVDEVAVLQELRNLDDLVKKYILTGGAKK